MKNMKKILSIILIMFLLILILKSKLDIINLNSRVEKLEKKNNGEIILFLGDSLTERYNFDKYFPNYYIINSGIGGNTTNDILNDMDNRVNKYNFNKLFLHIGINDLLFTNETNDEIKENIKQIINNINNKNAKVYLESIYPVNTRIAKNISENSNNKINNFNNILKDICNADKCTYINTYDSLIDKRGNLNKFYTSDGIHINKLGYIIITKKLIKYIK